MHAGQYNNETNIFSSHVLCCFEEADETMMMMILGKERWSFPYLESVVLMEAFEAPRTIAAISKMQIDYQLKVLHVSVAAGFLYKKGYNGNFVRAPRQFWRVCGTREALNIYKKSGETCSVAFNFQRSWTKEASQTLPEGEGDEVIR